MTYYIKGGRMARRVKIFITVECILIAVIVALMVIGADANDKIHYDKFGKRIGKTVTVNGRQVHYGAAGQRTGYTIKVGKKEVHYTIDSIITGTTEIAPNGLEYHYDKLGHRKGSTVVFATGVEKHYDEKGKRIGRSEAK